MFGNILRSQVEERLSFFETGDIPRKNCDVMAEALVQHKAEVAALMKKEKKEKKKRKLSEITSEEQDEPVVNGKF